MKEFKDTIQKYLDQRVAEDPLFAPKFENPKKNIDECCRYILGALCFLCFQSDTSQEQSA